MNKKKNLIAFTVVILFTGFYAFSLLRNMSSSFTLFPKNIPTFNGNYITGLVLRDAILTYHCFPFWSPLFEGGRVFLEYPVDVSFNPFSILMILFGEVEGMNLGWFLFFLCGAGSMFYLTRQVLKLPVFGAMFSSLVFSMSAFFSYLFENGIFYARELLLLPLLLAFFIKAKDSKKWLVLCSFVLALMCISTVFFFPVILLFLFIFSLSESIHYEKRRIVFESSYLKIFAKACLGALLLSAVKLVPMLTFFLTNNRISGAAYSYSVQDANTIFLFFQRILVAQNMGAGTMYIGVLPLVLCVIASVAYFERTKRLLCILIIFIVLSFGPNSFLDLHRLLWPLPGFHSIKEIAKYYGAIIVLIMAILSGYPFLYLNRIKGKCVKSTIAAIVIGSTYVNLLVSNSSYLNSFNTKLTFSAPEKDIYYVKALNFHQGDESITGSLLYFLMKERIGLIDVDFFIKRKPAVIPRYYLLPAYSFLMPSTSLVVMKNPDYRGEAFFLKKENTVGPIDIRPNLISVAVDVVSADLLVVNQNFDARWKSDAGIPGNHQGLLSLKIDTPGKKTVHMKFFPGMLFLTGAAVSAASLLTGIYLLTKKSHVPR